ncbi:MAG: hypothetical protein F4029_00725 [Gammaproteobacteria bacterium]|nr:hypothetical protein [Gammaproteobacteria bacterium]MYK44735.1 hypothetical protein [Gammaproteobacteria bacterium]
MLNPRALLAFVVPVAVAALAIVLLRDPTYRFPVLAFLLPLFLRGAGTAAGIYDRRRKPSLTARIFSTLGFAGFVVGWLLTFAVVGFVIAVGLFEGEPSGDLLEGIMFVAAAGLVLAAWFLWPWYAREVLANWPRQGVRIWTSSGNRWDRVFTGWRLQQMAASGAIRWRGFAATALVVACLMVLAAIGVTDGILARLAEVGALVLLIPAHVMVVLEAHALCERWTERANAQ